MLMQYLPEDERKGENRYKRGDWILYDDRPAPNDPEQIELNERWDSGKGGVIKLTCSYCGQTFYYETWGYTALSYCSQRCKNDAYMERRRQRHEKALQKVCTVCGSEYRAKKVDSMYCSPACKQKAYRKRSSNLNQR